MQQFKVSQFKNTIESYFRDGSKLQWRNNTITYFSQKGFKTKFDLQDLLQYSQASKNNMNKDLISKLSEILNTCNCFNDDVWINQFPQSYLGTGFEKQDSVFKKFKINEFVWDLSLNRVIQNQSNGFQLLSQDRNAKVTLDKNLYLVNVEYLQLFPGKKLQKSNHAKHLLEKYNYKYTEFPKESSITQFSYEYRKINKTFCIFNLPQRWYVPMHYIWRHILDNKLAKQKFCYIDFSQQQRDLHDIYKCYMPDCLKLEQRNNKMKQNKETVNFSKIAVEDSFVPIYGKANYSQQCSWSFIGKHQQHNRDMIMWFGEVNLFLDGVGYWFMQNNTAVYRKLNKEVFDKKIHISSIPHLIRIQNEMERQVKSHLNSFYSYINHNHKVQSLRSLQPKKQPNFHGDQIYQIFQVFDQGFGTLKAYSNETVVGNFIDKSIVTLRNNQIKIITPFGQIIQSSLQIGNRSNIKQYQRHISCLTDFQERIFYEEQWKQKKLLQLDIQFQKETTELFLKTSKSKY